jgi:hypothetical protein
MGLICLLPGIHLPYLSCKRVCFASFSGSISSKGDCRSGEPESLGEVKVLGAWSWCGEPKRSSEKMSLNIADLDSTVSEREEGLFEERGESSG